MELSSSYTRLRIAPTLLFFLSCISTAAPLTTTRYEYNDRGLITLIAEAEGSPQERITTQVWDTTKPLLLERVQGSQRTRFSYNSTDQLTDTIQDSLQ